MTAYQKKTTGEEGSQLTMLRDLEISHQDFIKIAAEGDDLDREQMQRAMQIMMAGGATPAQMAALVVFLQRVLEFLY